MKRKDENHLLLPSLLIPIWIEVSKLLAAHAYRRKNGKLLIYGIQYLALKSPNWIFSFYSFVILAKINMFSIYNLADIKSTRMWNAQYRSTHITTIT